MKTGLISAIAVAVLLLGSLIYWKTRPPEGATPGFHDQTSPSAPGSSVELSAGPSGPDGSAASPNDPETARSAAAPVQIAPPVLDDDLASSSEIPADEITPIVPTSIDEVQRVGAEVFEKRYEGVSADDRRAAQESLRVLLYSSQEGELGKGQGLTDEQILDFKREIEWLTLHESP